VICAGPVTQLAERRKQNDEHTHICIDYFYERTHILRNEKGATRSEKGEDEEGDFEGGVGVVRVKGVL
jgi:hypothetical protein